MKTKDTVTLTLDKEVFKKFRIKLIELDIKNMSKKIESLISEWLNNPK